MAGQFVFRVPPRADNASSSLSRQHPHHTAQLSSGITFVIFTEVVLVNSAPRAHHVMAMSNDHEKLTCPWTGCICPCLRARLNTSPAASANLSPDKTPGKILLPNNISFIAPWYRLARTSRWTPTMRRCALPCLRRAEDIRRWLAFYHPAPSHPVTLKSTRITFTDIIDSYSRQ